MNIYSFHSENDSSPLLCFAPQGLGRAQRGGEEAGPENQLPNDRETWGQNGCCTLRSRLWAHRTESLVLVSHQGSRGTGGNSVAVELLLTLHNHAVKVTHSQETQGSHRGTGSRMLELGLLSLTASSAHISDLHDSRPGQIRCPSVPPFAQNRDINTHLGT